jgi:formylglycine-generating enzyme required for sulfatase activity
LALAGCGQLLELDAFHARTDDGDAGAALDDAATVADVATPDSPAPGADSGPGCTIDGVAYGAGLNPGNACQTCAPASSPSGWTSVAGPCGDGAGTCQAGHCAMPVAPSCGAAGPGKTDCGAAVESCCTTLPVTGGTFYRRYTSDAAGVAAGLGDPATVSAFNLDKYEVTVGRFRAFVAAWNAAFRPALGAGKHTHLNGGKGLRGTNVAFEPGWGGSGDSANVAPTDANLTKDTGVFGTWTSAGTGNERRPINGVNWFEAYAFCAWDGGFLPSEAEWTYAAAGGSEQLAFPWGSVMPGSSATYAIYGCFYSGAAGCDPGPSAVAPVGTAPAGGARWGQLDLAGNVYEWTFDWFSDPYASPSVDGANTTPSATLAARSVRGGSYFYAGENPLRPWYRAQAPPADRSNNWGFRCARAP